MTELWLSQEYNVQGGFTTGKVELIGAKKCRKNLQGRSFGKDQMDKYLKPGVRLHITDYVSFRKENTHRSIQTFPKEQNF